MKFFALIPAAGTGSRLRAEIPKQYMEIAGRPLLYHALRALAQEARIERMLIVLAPGDERYRGCDWSEFGERAQPLYCGGETRAASVFNGLVAARDAIAAADWVLVHDAARPCLGAADLGRLVRELESDETGGLLAVPVADTLKRANREARVAHTEPRDNLWLAQTPQMFRYRLLLEALRAADPATATDEARAVETLGLKPKLVMGSASNIKVTYPEDLSLAEAILGSRQPSAVGRRRAARAGQEAGKKPGSRK